MLRSLAIIFFALAFSLPVAAQISTPKYSNEFLAIGVGARSMGMSNAVVASVDDVTSAYWNPANLTDIQSTHQASFMHAVYFGGIANYDYLGYATPIDSQSHFAASIIRLGVDDIPDTRFLYDANGALNYDNVRFFSAADYAFLVSYARKLPKWKNLQVGGNFKIIHRNVGDFANAWGFGLDAGAKIDLSGWKISLMLRDITGTFNAWSHNASLLYDVYVQTGNVIPETTIELTLPKALFGVSKRFLIAEKVGILAEIDIEFTFDGQRNVLVPSSFSSLAPVGGLEFDYLRIAYFRMGIGNFQEIKEINGQQQMTWQPNFGLGARIKNVILDYALTNVGNQADILYSHVFSLTVDFK